MRQKGCSMGLLKDFFNQTRKPEGFLGKLTIKSMNQSTHTKLADWGFEHLQKTQPKEILEIGCGGGRNAGVLAAKYPDAHVTAIDYSPLSVESTREYNRDLITAGRMTVLEADVSKLDLPEKHYDLATAFETVYFWPGIEACFAQVCKVLKPGGLFMIVNESDGTDAVSRKFESIIEGMHNYTVEDLTHALKNGGFSKVKSEHHAKKPWITVLAKKEGVE